MTVNKKDFAMVVVTCDAYSDLVGTFFDLQKKFMSWFDNNIYLINETVKFDFNDIKQIHVGNGVNWSKKVEIALNEINETYVLFMLEDYFIGRSVNKEHIDNAIKMMQENNLKYYKITAIPKIKKKSKYANYLSSIQSNVRYGVNLQAAIFNKEFLKEIVSGSDRNAWQTETDLLKNVTKKYERDLDGCVLDNRNIIDVHNGVIKGKYVPATVKFFKKQGINIRNSSRKTLSHREILSMKIKGFFSHIIPSRFVPKLKKVLKKFGFKFVSDN